jgi:hypothetical protein
LNRITFAQTKAAHGIEMNISTEAKG